MASFIEIKIKNTRLQLAHTEKEELYRLPHDHGRGWVIYSVQRGEMEMGACGRIAKEDGEFEIIQRESYRVHGIAVFGARLVTGLATVNQGVSIILELGNQHDIQ